MRHVRLKTIVASFAIVLCGSPASGQLTAEAGPVEELQIQINRIRAQVTALKAVVASQNLDLLALQTSVGTLENLTQYQSVEPGVINGLAGPHVIFEGVNLHIESGSGMTDDLGSNLGNVVVGYNELGGLTAADRVGSHNLIVGPEHSYTNIGGFVAGFKNTISGRSASVSGGTGNTASGPFTSVSGGGFSMAMGNTSSVSGGRDNTASSFFSSVSGGQNNESSGNSSSVSGGRGAMASGNYSSVSGGRANMASVIFSSVSGGSYNMASGSYSSVTGGLRNTASGSRSSVSGGRYNTAGGLRSSVSGGDSRTASGSDDWVAGGLFENN